MAGNTNSTGLVGRFALGSLVVLVLIGVGVTSLTARNIRSSREDAATFHATFVVAHVLAPVLSTEDLAGPIEGERYDELYELIWYRILADRQVVRVKLWAPDGRVLYSDAPAEIGRRFPGHVDELAEVLAGRVESEVTDLGGAEDRTERSLAERLFETYVPLRLDPQGPALAVAEIYQDYAHIEAEVDRQLGQLAVIFGIGLVLLWLALLPIARGAARRLRRQKRELEEQAERLSVLLAREQLTVAELQHLNRLKSDFIAVASHELRTPLTAILGYAKLLRRGDLATDETTREEFLASMERQGDRLLQLVENLLTTSRLESGELPVVLGTFELGAVLRDARESLGEAAGRIRVELPEDPVAMRSDRDRLFQVLANLLDNARKYSGEDTPIDLVATTDGDAVRIAVRDRGVGIDDAAIPHIFDRFYQADGSHTRPVGGVGLGLYLVGGLVESLGGTIEVRSQPGEGSTFTVTVPRDHPSVADGTRSGQRHAVPAGDGEGPDPRAAMAARGA